MSYCSNCGNEIKDDFDYCPECGISLHETIASEYGFYSEENLKEYKVCSNCKGKMPMDAFYCFACGTTFDSKRLDLEAFMGKDSTNDAFSTNVTDSSGGEWKNKWVAFFLCLFFGVFGMHRFYEGKKITGLLYLFTFGILGMGVFFDLILILAKPRLYRVK